MNRSRRREGAAITVCPRSERVAYTVRIEFVEPADRLRLARRSFFKPTPG